MNVIKTAGTRPDDEFILFLACTQTLQQMDICKYPYRLVSLLEFNPRVQDEFERQIDQGHRIFVDSGAFGLAASYQRETGCSLSEAFENNPENLPGWNKLYESYLEFVEQWGDKVWGYVELDLGGRENKRRIRQKLNSMGYYPIPVFHPMNDGWDYFHELAGTHDRICIGNMVKMSKPGRVSVLAKIMALKKDYPGLWIHILGVGFTDLCSLFPFESFDASTWNVSLRMPRRNFYSTYKTVDAPMSCRPPFGGGEVRTKHIQEMTEEYGFMRRAIIEHRKPQEQAVTPEEIRDGLNALVSTGYFDQLLTNEGKDKS